jgi:hypothetical protein
MERGIGKKREGEGERERERGRERERERGRGSALILPISCFRFFSKQNLLVVRVKLFRKDVTRFH